VLLVPELLDTGWFLIKICKLVVFCSPSPNCGGFLQLTLPAEGGEGARGRHRVEGRREGEPRRGTRCSRRRPPWAPSTCPGEPELLHLHSVRRDLGVDQLEEEDEGLDSAEDAGGFQRRRIDAGVLRLVARLHGGGAGRREAALVGNRRRARGWRAAAPRRFRREAARTAPPSCVSARRWRAVEQLLRNPFLSTQ
jgi:hypothetical protein